MAARQVVVKAMAVSKPIDEVFEFFSDVKNMEIGGAIYCQAFNFLTWVVDLKYH
ncbi:MAG: hypothetical protein WA941_17990 [Nitrososphaeraceae archaeon]